MIGEDTQLDTFYCIVPLAELLKKSYNVGPLILIYSQTLKFTDVIFRNMIVYSDPKNNKIVLALSELDSKDKHLCEINVSLDS